MGDCQKLEAWQRARLLARRIYLLTGQFPAGERYGLTAQMRRAALSIMANIAEGAGRNGDREMIRFIRIALGSAVECESHLVLAADLDLLKGEDMDSLREDITRIRRMLAGLIRRLAETRTGDR